ncbi:hypothetical protein GCM10018792_08950 [Streptomyces rubradiris]|nr:hypothetical protein GCM10018792_08950 [Streptomyces rubradiris]
MRGLGDPRGRRRLPMGGDGRRGRAHRPGGTVRPAGVTRMPLSPPRVRPVARASSSPYRKRLRTVLPVRRRLPAQRVYGAPRTPRQTEPAAGPVGFPGDAATAGPPRGVGAWAG